MFGLFRRRDKYPELSTADRLIIAERKAAHDAWFKLYQRRDRGSESHRAYAAAVCDGAMARIKRADAEYDAMMARLKSEAAALIQAAKES